MAQCPSVDSAKDVITQDMRQFLVFDFDHLTEGWHMHRLVYTGKRLRNFFYNLFVFEEAGNMRIA